MPKKVCLYPSNNDVNYANGGTERYYMYAIAKEITYFLNSCGIQNEIKFLDDESQKIDDNCLNLMLSIGLNGDSFGITIYYYEKSPDCNASQLIEKNLHEIYHTPDCVKCAKIKTRCHKININIINVELGRLGNLADEDWIRDNIENIAKSFGTAICEYFDGYFEKNKKQQFFTTAHMINLFEKPSLKAEVIGVVPANTKLEIFGEWDGWILVNHNDKVGYINQKA